MKCFDFFIHPPFFKNLLTYLQPSVPDLPSVYHSLVVPDKTTLLPSPPLVCGLSFTITEILNIHIFLKPELVSPDNLTRMRLRRHGYQKVNGFPVFVVLISIMLNPNLHYE